MDMEEGCAAVLTIVGIGIAAILVVIVIFPLTMLVLLGFIAAGLGSGTAISLYNLGKVLLEAHKNDETSE